MSASHGTVLSNSAESKLHSSKSLPDFVERNSKYTNQLLHGRHPRSFPRQSELWHHYNESTRRLEETVKGHELWNIIKNDDDEGFDEQSQSNHTYTDDQQQSQNSGAIHSILPAKSQADLFYDIFKINVDFKGKFRMHYGMPIVIVNFLEQVLCINEWDELQCKPFSQLIATDKIKFKLLDLAEPLNPGPVRYGAQLWLQIMDANGVGDNAVQTGQVLGAKLFGPPEMRSMQLHQQIRKSTDNKSEVSIANESSFASSQTLSNATELSSPARGMAGIEQTQNSGNNAPRKKGLELAQICGGVKAVKIAVAKHEGETAKEEKQRYDLGRQRQSKQSWQLGQFVAHCALRTPDTEDPEYLNSQVPVILEQDLYCMATSHGSGYRPWPKRSRDVLRSSGMGMGMGMNMNITNSPAAASRPVSPVNSQSMAARDRSRGGTSGATGQPSLGSKEDVVHSDDSDFACLRRVVMRGLPYEHIVDRRCVWRFCVVEDNPGDLSAKEQRAQKLLKRARDVLDKSQSNRKGNRTHPGLLLDSQPLVGGERFPKMLRQIVSQSTLRSETSTMMTRRKKEERIAQHLHVLFEHSAISLGGRGGNGKSHDPPLPGHPTDAESHSQSPPRSARAIPSSSYVTDMARLLADSMGGAGGEKSRRDFRGKTDSSTITGDGNKAVKQRKSTVVFSPNTTDLISLSKSSSSSPSGNTRSHSPLATHNTRSNGHFPPAHTNQTSASSTNASSRSGSQLHPNLHGSSNSSSGNSSHRQHGVGHAVGASGSSDAAKRNVAVTTSTIAKKVHIDPDMTYGDELLATHILFADGHQKAKGVIALRPKIDTQTQTTRAIEQANSNSLKLARRLEALQAVDDHVQEALRHRSRLHQYKRISNLFEESRVDHVAGDVTPDVEEPDDLDFLNPS